MTKKKAGAKKATHKATSKSKPKRAAQQAKAPPSGPLQIMGVWTVRQIKLTPPEKTIGVEGESKFKIRPDGTQIVLDKKANVAWNAGNSDPIPLHDLPPNHIDRQQGMVVGATVKLGGKDFELTLGPKDRDTLRIQLVPLIGDQTNPGGSGSAGRDG